MLSWAEGTVNSYCFVKLHHHPTDSVIILHFFATFAKGINALSVNTENTPKILQFCVSTLVFICI